MQFVTQQDLFNTVTSWKYYLAIVYDLRPKIEFDACHVIKAQNLDISSVHEDLSKIKESKADSITFLKQQNGYENFEKSAVINVYFITGKNTDAYIIDVHAIFANCIAPNRLYYLDVDFDTFKQNYSVTCSSSSEQESRESNIYRTPNEIIPGLFLGGYRTPEKMHQILQELKITHILNCAKEFTPNSDGKSNDEYKVPDNVIVHHIEVSYEPNSQINFAESFQFIDSALNEVQSQSSSLSSSSSSSSSSSIIHSKPRVFVHCQAGMSRSATIVIGYLMDKFHLTFFNALEFAVHQRSVVCPDQILVQQLFLKEYELVDQFGVIDNELIKQSLNYDNQLSAIEIELKKKLQPLINLQDISRLPKVSDSELMRLRSLFQSSYQQAKDKWNNRKQDEDQDA